MAYGRDECHWLVVHNFVLRRGRIGKAPVDFDGDLDIDIDVDVEVVEAGQVDDVMDAAAGRDRADERLPLEQSASAGFFKSMVGLREEAAG